MDDASFEAYAFLVQALWERVLLRDGASGSDIARVENKVCADHASLPDTVWEPSGATSQQIADHRLQVLHRIEQFFDDLRLRFDPDEPVG